MDTAIRILRGVNGTLRLDERGRLISCQQLSDSDRRYYEANLIAIEAMERVMREEQHEDE